MKHSASSLKHCLFPYLILFRTPGYGDSGKNVARVTFSLLVKSQLLLSVRKSKAKPIKKGTYSAYFQTLPLYSKSSIHHSGLFMNNKLKSCTTLCILLSLGSLNL